MKWSVQTESQCHHWLRSLGVVTEAHVKKWMNLSIFNIGILIKMCMIWWLWCVWFDQSSHCLRGFHCSLAALSYQACCKWHQEGMSILVFLIYLLACSSLMIIHKVYHKHHEACYCTGQITVYHATHLLLCAWFFFALSVQKFPGPTSSCSIMLPSIF